MRWERSHRADARALPLANRHYPRQKPDSKQFVRPSRNVVFLTPECNALWVSTYSFPEYCDHAWPGAWECATFRNEGSYLSSELITEAVAATRYLWRDLWPTPPAEGFITMVDESKVRHKRDPGRCFRKAGWKRVGKTKSGKLVFHLAPQLFPPAAAPLGELPMEAA